MKERHQFLLPVCHWQIHLAEVHSTANGTGLIRRPIMNRKIAYLCGVHF